MKFEGGGHHEAACGRSCGSCCSPSIGAAPGTGARAPRPRTTDEAHALLLVLKVLAPGNSAVLCMPFGAVNRMTTAGYRVVETRLLLSLGHLLHPTFFFASENHSPKYLCTVL
jgi:hypothetical protein